MTLTPPRTRRDFIRGVAVGGASTAAAVALDGTGFLDLASDEALAAGPNPFSAFDAIAASGADAFSVPEGYRADVVIAWGDAFANTDGTTYTYGFNNDFLAYFPIKGSDEGLLFVNHEYPAPIFQHGVTDPAAKTREQIRIEQESVGNSIVHVRRRAEGGYEVVSPSPYNRRITADDGDERSLATFTGPLAGRSAYAGIGTTAHGSLANCSGGITPWGTALSCEENFQDYAGYGWTEAKLGTNDYELGDGSSAHSKAKYGWVVEHDPFDPSSTPRKHTALGRFRHENTTFRTQEGKPLVLYMGEDRTGGGVYKFVSDRPYLPGRAENNRRILESGTLFIARWEPQGRRTFAAGGDVTPTSATSGDGTWVEIAEADLVDTYRLLRERYGTTTWDDHFATNRPEDLEVDEDGTVFIALTNNSDVKDTFGSIRRLVEDGDAATSRAFDWEDYAAGGPSGRGEGEQGFASPDNLVFDKAGNLWVVTDISSSKLGDPSVPEAFHANNAVFMIPRTGPNAGVAFRFANMPIQAEGTGPYFTPDEQTLFVNVQHPGEETKGTAIADYTSYWPAGNRTTGQNPTKPRPATIAVTKVSPAAAGAGGDGSPDLPVPPPGQNPDGTPAKDADRPALNLLSPAKQKLRTLVRDGLAFELRVDEPVTLRVTLYGRPSVRRRRPRRRTAQIRLARRTVQLPAGTHTVKLRPGRVVRALLRRERRLPAEIAFSARDGAGNVTTRRKSLRFD